MKYPLAITNKLLDVYGDNIALGYDITCTFMKSVEKSTLGPIARSKHLTGITPSFHGYAHNQLCQVYWHPMYVEGIGKEDLEGCERIFSASNALASVTRLSTAFHRVQDIEEHFLFWDESKHVESGIKLLVSILSSLSDHCFVAQAISYSTIIDRPSKLSKQTGFSFTPSSASWEPLVPITKISLRKNRCTWHL